MESAKRESVVYEFCGMGKDVGEPVGEFQRFGEEREFLGEDGVGLLSLEHELEDRELLF